jgi:CYTH domain-containing protein
VEFKDEKDSEEFKKPVWFSLEVTDDKRFKNQNLALSSKVKLEELKDEIRLKIGQALK